MMDVAYKQSQHISRSQASMLHDTEPWDPLSSIQPTLCSTPHNKSTWADVVVRGRRTSSEPAAPSLSLSNRFTALSDNTDTVQNMASASAHPAPADSSPPQRPIATQSARNEGQRQRDSKRTSAPSSRRQLLQEAVLRRSGGFPCLDKAGSPPDSAQRRAAAPRCLNTAENRHTDAAPVSGDPHRPNTVENPVTYTARKQRSPPAAAAEFLPLTAADDPRAPPLPDTVPADIPTSVPTSSPDHSSPITGRSGSKPSTYLTIPSSPPRPLFIPTTLIIGDSIIRHVRYFNAITHCFPGATVRTLLAKLPGLLQAAPPTIYRIIIHVGTNDTALEQSEITKNDFRDLFMFLKTTGLLIFISGPIPTLGRGAGRFSRILSLNSWLQYASISQDFGFIDNFNLFWDRHAFFRYDGLHPNAHGTHFLTANIRHSIIHYKTD